MSCRLQQIRRPIWSKQQEQQVQHLRLEFPLWGKRKLWKVLSRDYGFALSISTVGHILRKLLKLNRIKPVSFCFGRAKPRHQRQFTHHAKRWRYGMKAKRLGELMQMDHMSVGFTQGFQLKEFKATCPVTGTTIMSAYSGATSRNTKHFLGCLKQHLPFELLSIQVDSGSEFRNEFEAVCQAQAITLWIFHPERLNGMVAWSVPAAQRVMSFILFMKVV